MNSLSSVLQQWRTTLQMFDIIHQLSLCVRCNEYPRLRIRWFFQTFKQLHLDHRILNLRVRADIHEAAEGQPKVSPARIDLKSTWIPNSQTIHVYSHVQLVTSIYSLGSSRGIFCMQGHQASNTSPERFRGGWYWKMFEVHAVAYTKFSQKKKQPPTSGSMLEFKYSGLIPGYSDKEFVESSTFASSRRGNETHPVSPLFVFMGLQFSA